MQDDFLGIVKTKEFMDCFPTRQTSQKIFRHLKTWNTSNNILSNQLIKWSKVQMSKLQMPQPTILVDRSKLLEEVISQSMLVDRSKHENRLVIHSVETMCVEGFRDGSKSVARRKLFPSRSLWIEARRWIEAGFSKKPFPNQSLGIEASLIFFDFSKICQPTLSISHVVRTAWTIFWIPHSYLHLHALFLSAFPFRQFPLWPDAWKPKMIHGNYMGH